MQQKKTNYKNKDQRFKKLNTYTVTENNKIKGIHNNILKKEHYKVIK